MIKHVPNIPTVTILPKTAPGGLTAGLDWAKDDHVVCVLDNADEVRDRCSVEYGRAGRSALLRRLANLG